MSTNNKKAAEPMDEWVDYAKRSGLLDENGVAPDPSKAQTAWFAFTYAWNRRSALTASEAPATEQAPPLPEFDYYVTLENGDDYGCWSRQTMRAYAQQYAAWKIAALRSKQAPAGEVPVGSRELNDACWSFVGALPHQLPGPIWNDLKPAIKAAIEKYLALSTPPVVPQGHPWTQTPPTEQGEYWWWNGDELRPLRDTLGGWWIRIDVPALPSDDALSAAPAQPQKEQPT